MHSRPPPETERCFLPLLVKRETERLGRPRTPRKPCSNSFRLITFVVMIFASLDNEFVSPLFTNDADDDLLVSRVNDIQHTPITHS